MDTHPRLGPIRIGPDRTALKALGISAAALTVAAAAAAPALAAPGGQPDGHNPPGNNGTVFIHDVAGDESPHNVPHVACNFYVDLFGFDADQSVTISFAGQAPTGAGTPLGGSWTGVASTDDAGGAGNDFDLEVPFTADQLGVDTLGAPAHQGYHVKMTVATGQPEQSQNGKKTKVFWLQPCTTAGAATEDNGAETGTDEGATESSGETGSGSAPEDTAGESGEGAEDTNAESGTAAPVAGQETGEAAVLGLNVTKKPATPTNVIGQQFNRGAPAAADATLPFTGSEIGAMTAAAAVTIAAGAGLILAGRRRSRRISATS